MTPFHIFRDRNVEHNDVYSDQSNVTSMYAHEAARFVRDTALANEPFFLMVSFNSPHDPLYSSNAQRSRPDGRSSSGLYGDAVEDIDRAIGTVIGELVSVGAEENTIVLFTSDNGPWYEGSTRAGRNGSSPLRGRKATPFEGGFRVPGIMRWPRGGVGVAANGHTAGPCCATHDSLAHFMDLLPTLLAACGLHVPVDRVLDGDDLLPAFRDSWARRNDSTAARPTDAAGGIADGAKASTRHFYYFSQNTLAAVRNGRWKLHLPHIIEPAEIVRARTCGREGTHGVATNGAVGGWMWLSDLDVPGESYDHTMSHPRVAEAMYDEAVKWSAAFEANPRGWKQPPSWQKGLHDDASPIPAADMMYYA